MKKPSICIVVAIGRHRELGKDGKLLWHIPEDLKRFKILTTGHPIVMGRKTYVSILQYNKGNPLLDRTNIVLTRHPDAEKQFHEHVFKGLTKFAASLEEAFEIAKHSPGGEEIHIGGGA